MSGHSKWHSIKHKKGATDAKRGKLFTKVIRELTIAARLGGGDPDSNPRLRTAVDKAKGANMPADNITRAIKKGTGELEGITYEEMTIEGYGPGGVALLIEGPTDNRNRTIAEVRHPLSKHNRNLGNPGSVAYMFHPKGVIAVAAEKTTEDALMEIVLDAGADDIVTEEQGFTVYTAPPDFEAVRDAVTTAGIEPDEAEIKKIADNNVSLEGPKAQQMLKFLDALEDHDDIQNVWENSEISAKDLEATAAG